MGQAQFEKALQTRLILASDGDLIELESGNFQISGSLSLEGKKKITIRGKGMDKTVLSFKDQQTGAEGIKITNCENIVLEDLTVQDSKGDLIKTMHVKDITFRRIKAEWTGGPKLQMVPMHYTQCFARISSLIVALQLGHLMREYM